MLKSIVPGGLEAITQSISEGISNELFTVHFILHHSLYRLGDLLSTGDEYRLEIRSVNTYLLILPGEGFCPSVMDVDGIPRVCGNPADAGYCDFHRDAIERLGPYPVADGLREYYLNPANLHTTHTDALRSMADSLWETQEITLDHAFEVLELKIDSGLAALETRYRRKLKQNHPDTGGDTETCLLLQKAYRRLKKFYTLRKSI